MVDPKRHKPCSIHLLDGGLGTTLADHFSISFDDTTPLWSSQLLLTSPSTLLSAQTAFANAGADVILTATYQASFEGFAASGVHDEDEAGKAMRSAVSLARQAFQSADKGGNRDGKKAKVALSLGAYGATMVPSQEYSGKYDAEHVTVQQLAAWHRKRIGVFFEGEEGGNCWGEVDFVAFETVPRIEEVWAVREVMSDVNLVVGREGKRGFWISCVFPRQGNLLPDGSSVQDVVKAMLGREGGAVPMGIGINCTKIGKVEGLVLDFEGAIEEIVGSGEVAEWPSLAIYPDGTNGEVYNTVTKEWEKKDGVEQVGSWDESLFEIVRRAQERACWKSIFVGGCCKSAPDDIAKLRRRIDTART